VGFNDLLGNPRIRHILRSYLNNDIIPFSMIFFGPGSANMLDFAVAFSKGVNCLDMHGDFCGTCVNCVEIEKEIFLDLKVLVPDGAFYKKEQITFLVEDNFNRPIKGRRKINVLTEAHKMNENAANAFLKVLEEPALSNVFILLTDNMNALLPTIKSRCQVLNFSPLGYSEIKTSLKAKGYDEEKASLMAHLGSNIENALSMDYDEFMKKRERGFTVLNNFITQQGMESILLELYDKSKSREGFVDFFRELVNILSVMIRDLLVLKFDEHGKYIINIDYKEKLRALCRFITVEKLLFLIRKMEYLLRDIQRNLNTRILILEFVGSYTNKEVNDV